MRIDNRVGEPDLSLIPAHILPGKLPPDLHKLFEFGYSIDRQGLPRTLQAVANNFNVLHNAKISPEQVVMADGARAAATVAATYIKKKCRRISAPRVLLLKPGYNLYNNQFADLGFIVDEVHTNNIDDIRKSLRQDTVILPITNPNNPTGEIFSEEFLRGLLALLEEFPNLHIINDSVYDRITRVGLPTPQNIFALANEVQRARVFEVSGLAKSYSYPAIRVGWVITDALVAAEIQEIKDPMLGPLNNIAQIVAIAALEHTPAEYHEEVKEAYDQKLALVHGRLAQFGGKIPDATFYYWLELPNAAEVVEKCAAQNVFLADGKKFGNPNAIRINCAVADDVLEKICDAIIEASK